jgi:P-type Ca2+ transporter type 2C
VIEATALRCVEASLTGESEPVEKTTAPLDDDELPLGDRSNMLIKGTSIAAEHTVAVIVATGMATEIGRIADLLVADNAVELTLMALCIIIGLPAPLLPIHLLWINLVTDGLPALCLVTDPIDSDVMTQPPRSPSENLIDRRSLAPLIIAIAIPTALCFSIFIWATSHLSFDAARSMTFTVLVYCALLKSFSFRSATKPLWLLSMRSNLALPLVVAASFAMQLLLHHQPFLSHLLKTVTPPWPERWLMLGLGFIPLMTLELAKVWRARGTHRE